MVLTLTTLGVVYGDIATSPLYAIRECFHGEYGIEPSAANVVGVLSLILWTLITVVTVKYLSMILRADNDGEGGIIALLAQVHVGRRPPRLRRLLLAVGLFGAALLYGDGMITPAISVLSSVEGLSVAAPTFTPFILPVTVIILAILFIVQRRGTARVGAIFGPVTLAWLVTLAALGLGGIVRTPAVLAAANPAHAVGFFLRNGFTGYFVLGAVFLVVTGTEALFADMGHFGKRPIRLAWYGAVLPALLMNYFGQGARLLADPAAASQPFYSLVPAWAYVPLVALATCATVIASQAVISGAFSLTRQAIQLGYCPRLRIVHTSSDEIGQIYIPEINWLLMVATIGLVIGFGASSRLAAAYGVAVTSTMIITTLLFYVVARERWSWGRLAAGAPVAVFFVVDVAFFGANVGKIAHGAWFPLAIGVVAYLFMSTWKRGRDTLARRFTASAVKLDTFLKEMKGAPPTRVPGAAVFMTGNLDVVPPALINNLAHNKVLHEVVVLFTSRARRVPYIPPRKRLDVVDLGNGFYQVTAEHGYMQSLNIPRELKRGQAEGLPIEAAQSSYFLGRERLLPRRTRGMPAWRGWLFAFMSRNAVDAAAFFGIPPDRVIEIGGQVKL
ncbi:MAG: potassium transporter Kup [Acidobacteriota bacterium]